MIVVFADVAEPFIGVEEYVFPPEVVGTLDVDTALLKADDFPHGARSFPAGAQRNQRLHGHLRLEALEDDQLRVGGVQRHRTVQEQTTAAAAPMARSSMAEPQFGQFSAFGLGTILRAPGFMRSTLRTLSDISAGAIRIQRIHPETGAAESRCNRSWQSGHPGNGGRQTGSAPLSQYWNGSSPYQPFFVVGLGQSGNHQTNALLRVLETPIDFRWARQRRIRLGNKADGVFRLRVAQPAIRTIGKQQMPFVPGADQWL